MFSDCPTCPALDNRLRVHLFDLVGDGARVIAFEQEFLTRMHLPGPRGIIDGPCDALCQHPCGIAPTNREQRIGVAQQCGMVSGIVSGQRDFRARGYCLQQHNAEGFAARRGEDRDIGAAQQGWFGRFLNEPGEGDRRVEPGSSASAFLEQRAFAGHRHMGAGGEEPVLFAVFDCIKQDIRALAFDETAEEHNMRGDGFTVQCADIDSVSPIAIGAKPAGARLSVEPMMTSTVETTGSSPTK